MIIYWTDNFKLNKKDLKKAIKKIKNDPECIISKETEKCYSSYNIQGLNNRPEIIFLNNYKKIIFKFMKDMNLFNNTSFSFDHWMQVYTKEMTHIDCHDHFKYETIFSYVHFVKTSKKQCFYFLSHEGNKIYPKKQNLGDFIVFPSWALHGTDPIEYEEERVVIAGNINFDEFCGNNANLTPTSISK